MSVYTVRRDPAQVYDGSQGAVTCVNQGSSTVYLGDQSSIAPDNGYPLPPGAQVVWQAGKPLWAVTALAECRLNVSNVAMVTDQGTPSVQRLVYTLVEETPSPAHNTPVFETSGYETLLLRGFTTTPESFIIEYGFSWFDDSRNLIFTESVVMAKFDAGIFSVNIPVKGAYCQVNTLADMSWACNSLAFYGTSRKYPLTAQSYNAVRGASSATVAVQRGVVRISFLPGNSAGFFTLPAWGVNLTIAALLSTGGTPLFVIRDAQTQEPYWSGQPKRPTDQDPALAVYNVIVPVARPLQLACVGVNENTKITLNWSDYV